MPLVYTPVKFKGRKGEVETTSIANSGAELVVLTKELAEKIDPEPLSKEKVDVEVAGGIKLKSSIYLIEVEVKNPNTGESRKEAVHAIILPDQDIPLLGVDTMEKLKIYPDVVEGKLKFK